MVSRRQDSSSRLCALESAMGRPGNLRRMLGNSVYRVGARAPMPISRMRPAARRWGSAKHKPNMGFLPMLAGLDREGPVLKLMFGGGVYNYILGALGNIEVSGRQLGGPILPGWRFIRDGITVTVFLGYDSSSTI